VNTTARFDLESPCLLNPEQIRFFRDNGYIKLKNVLSADALNYYGREITEKVRELNTLDLPMEQRTTYQKAFLQVMNIWTRCDIVREFVFGKRLARLAAELMGTRGVRLYHDQALYKEAGGGFTPWHADQYYWPVDTPNTCTVWVPLQATPLEMGSLAFSVRSHRVKFGRDMEISDDSEAKISKQLLEQKLPQDETPFDLGEVSYHYGWTFHRAGPNRSTAPRRVMTMIYMDMDARLHEPKNKNQRADWETWLPGVRVGALCASPINPVLYSAG
jgi:ectoine hydroxylase-related dioxygenase (phytanoyl-CoA dioxygenase family)